MKKLLLCYLGFYFMMVSCATLPGERNVTNNVFYSSEPQMRIKVSPELQYVGPLQTDDRITSVEGNRQLYYQYEYHGFVKPYPNSQKVESALAVVLTRMETYFTSDLFGTVPNKLEHGVFRLGKTNFQFCTSVVYPSARSQLVQMLHEKGYLMGRGIQKIYSYVWSSRGDQAISILYYEALEPQPGSALSGLKWNEVEDLTSEQKEYLKRVNERFMSACKFVE